MEKILFLIFYYRGYRRCWCEQHFWYGRYRHQRFDRRDEYKSSSFFVFEFLLWNIAPCTVKFQISDKISTFHHLSKIFMGWQFSVEIWSITHNMDSQLIWIRVWILWSAICRRKDENWMELDPDLLIKRDLWNNRMWTVCHSTLW